MKPFEVIIGAWVLVLVWTVFASPLVRARYLDFTD